jgi:branched-chain amino acid transport system substrate-binding protein
VALAGCVGSGTQPETFTVGAIYPLSGGLAELGQSMQALCENAVDIVNNSYTDLGPLTMAEGEGLTNHGNAEVELLVADHRADPGQGRAEAERLIQQEGADMLYGSYNSSVTSTVSQVAEREGIPHVNGESSSPDLTERGLNWFWRTGPSDRTYTQNMFEMINGLNERVDDPIETAAIIHEDTEYGSVSAEVQQQLCEENDIEIVAGPISYTAESVSSLTSEIQRIKDADPDVLFPTSYVQDALLMAEDMRTQDFMPPLVLAQNSGHTSNQFINQTELSNYFCSRTDFTTDTPEVVPEMGTYREFVTSNTDVPLNDFAALVRTWGGLLCGLTAVNQADSVDPGAIQTALNEFTIDRLASGLLFGVEFNENGQNQRASGVIGQFEGGESNLVWPFDLAGEDALTHPAPGWGDR